MSNPLKEKCATCNNPLSEHRGGDLACPFIDSGLFHANDKFESKVEPVDQSRSISTTAPTADMVNSPSHYANNYPIEAIDIIKASLQAMFGDDWEIAFKGHCVATELKYRLRAGFKDADRVKQDIDKAMWYNQARREL